MKLDLNRARDLLQKFDFRKLFVEELGWANCPMPAFEVKVDEHVCRLTALAEQGGMVIYECQSVDGADIPHSHVRKAVDRHVTKRTFEHLIIFTDKPRQRSVWLWVKREKDKPSAPREHTFHAAQPGDSLLQKLDGLFFDLDELDADGRVPIITVMQRVTKAFDLEKVTKKFYESFQTEHDRFLKFLDGIKHADHRGWYASVMLNRLMFIYFIQKKGLLDSDHDYLTHRLAAFKTKNKDQFYRKFLKPLFFEGFATEEKERSADTHKLLGKIPYLNGGIFLEHQIEVDNPNLQIPDNAFDRLFAFFDKYRWHLDDRPYRRDDEINPDVLGYIFEKYINQKQMGAYYTKEDITDYICKNTILPFLFDKLATFHPKAVSPLPIKMAAQASPPVSGSASVPLAIDAYIYPAVKKGADKPLPPEIAAGIKDVAKRSHWNKPAAADFALPTEIWREVVARRQRCEDIRAKFKAGEIRQINDLITLNLDIVAYTQDFLRNLDEPLVLRAFYFECLKPLSVLDPTCGSGAFLFAALNILEPLYELCLDKMEEFISTGRDAYATKIKYKDFADELKRVADHANRRHFIYKNIIVGNLYGVDIMEEAVEICKLRLFLKLVAEIDDPERIEPLPDIDFNIRAGNTLVGYATLDEVKNSLFGNRVVETIKKVDLQLRAYRTCMTEIGISAAALRKNKEHIRELLTEIDDKLDQSLSSEYGAKTFTEWKRTHQPFHWYVEFNHIIQNGGFDAIVGNPPYISAAKVRKHYTVKGLKTEDCTDIYAWMLERISTLLQPQGCSGMIVPLSLGFSGDFDSCRRLLFADYRRNWFSSFGRIPSALFNFDVRVRNTIHIGHKSKTNHANYTTRLHRWFEEARPFLFPALEYAPFEPQLWKFRIPKLNTVPIAQTFEATLKRTRRTLDVFAAPRATRHALYFKKTAYNWLNFCREMPPCYTESGKQVEHTQFDEIYFNDEQTRALFQMLCNGKLMLVFWFAIGDDFHVTRWNFGDFPIDIAQLTEKHRTKLLALAPALETAMSQAVQYKLNAGRRVGNYNLAKCREVTDKSDAVFAEALGLGGVWEDIELYYTQTMKTNFNEEA